MSVFLSIIKCKCPKCHEGNLFVESNPYKLKKMTDMNRECSVCGQPSEPEPGFYYGAMYVSYGLCVAICGFNFILTEFILKLPAYSFLFVNTFVLIALWPLIFRYARVVYLYLFVRFDPDAKSRNKKSKF